MCRDGSLQNRVPSCRLRGGTRAPSGNAALAGRIQSVRMTLIRYWLWLPILSVLPVTGALPAALAAEGGKGPSEAIFIGEIVVLMLVGRLLGEAMLRLRQPAVMGQLIAGLLLGPSFFGLLFPDAQHALFPKNPDQKAMID